SPRSVPFEVKMNYIVPLLLALLVSSCTNHDSVVEDAVDSTLVVPEHLIPEGFESAEATLSYLIAEKCLLYADEFLAERVEAIGLFGASLTCVESCMSGGCHEMSLGFLEEI